MSENPENELAEELLARSADVLEEKGWVRHALATPQGGHCALGAIGYARWGDKFDKLVINGEVDPEIPVNIGENAYRALSRDPVTAAAVNNLANQVRESQGLLPITLTDRFYSSHDDHTTVYHWNDNQPGWSTTVLNTFRKLGRPFLDRFKRWNKGKDIVVPAIDEPVMKKPRVEHIKDGAAPPVEEKEEVT